MLEDKNKLNGRAAVRQYGSSASPLVKGIKTEYDRELEQVPVDSYELEGQMALADPESSLVETNWLRDAWRTFSKNRDEINLMSERARLIKEINPELEDIDFEIGHLDNKRKLQELSQVLNNTAPNSPDYEKVLNEFNALKNTVDLSQKQFTNTLAKYGETEEDFSPQERYNLLNERKEKLLSEKEEVGEEINELYDSLKQRGPVSNRYQIKEQISQDAPAFSGEYIKNVVPGIAGSSFATLGQYATAIGASGIVWLGQRAAMAAASSALAAGTVGIATPMAIASIASLAAATTTVLGNLYSRRRESLAQVYGAYKSRVTEDLQNKYGIDINQYVSAAREDLKKTMSSADVDKLSDDEITDRILSGEIQVADSKLKEIGDSAQNGLQSVYDRNMALSAMDIAETALVAAPIGKVFSKLISKTISPIAKPLSKLAAPVTKKYSKIVDDTVAWGSRLALESPKKAIALKTAKDLSKLGFSAVGEMFEEGSQDVFDHDYIKGKFDEKSSGYLSALAGMIDGNYRTAKILSGIDSESELANDPQFWNDVKGGLALGVFLGGGPATYHSVVGSAKQLAANTFVRDLVIDNITKKDQMNKVKLYADKGVKRRYNYNDDVISVLEAYKKNLPDGVTEEDVNAEIDLAKSVFNAVQNKEVQAIAKQAGFDPGSEEFNAYVGLTYNAKDEVKKSAENKDAAIKTLSESLQKLSSDPIFASLSEQDKQVAVALTNTNARREAVDQLINELESVPEEAYRKYGITDLANNPIAKALLKEAKQIKKNLESEAKAIVTNTDTKYGEDYKAESETTDKVGADYMADLFATADYNTQLDNYNALRGMYANEKGGLTGFKKLPKESKEKVGEYVKSKVNKYLKDLTTSKDVATENARGMVEENKPKEEKAPENKPFDPSAKPTVDDSFVPEVTEEKAVSKDVVEEEPGKPSFEPLLSFEEDEQGPTLEELSAQFEEDKRKALQESTDAKPQVTEKPAALPKVTEDDVEGVGTIDERSDELEGARAEADEENLLGQLDKERDNPTELETIEEKELRSDAQIALESDFNDIAGTNPRDVDNALHLTGIGNNLVSQTVYYNPDATKPMLPGYKTGKELSDLLSKQNALQECTFRFFIDQSFTEKGYKKYVPGNRATYDGATVMMEISHPTGKYLTSLKTPNAAAFIEPLYEAIDELRANRNAIITALENAKEGQEVVPVGMHRSNGSFNQNTRTDENGLTRPVFRSILEIKGMGIPSNGFEINPTTVDIAIGKGVVDDFVLFGSDGQRRPGRGGSGQIFFMTKPSQSLSGKQIPIQLNPKRFSDELSYILTELALKYTESTEYIAGSDVAEINELFNFIVRFGVNTEVKSNDPRVGWLRDKQFFINENGQLVLGNKVYNRSTITAEEREEIRSTFKSMHWRVNKDTFWKPLAEALPSILEHFAITNAEKFNVGREIVFTKEQFFGNEQAPKGMTVMGWMIQNGLIEGDLKDDLFNKPFLYFDGISTTEGDTLSKPSVEKAAEKSEALPAVDSQEAKPEQPKSEEVPTTKAVEDSEESEFDKEVKRILATGEDPFSVENMFGGGFAKPITGVKPAERQVTQKEIQWFKNKLGLSSENLEIVDQAIALGNSQYAMGLCRLYSTVLWKGAEEGTLYHEAFHKVSLLLLSPKERRQVYQFYRNRNKQFEGTDQQIEELLAEEFRKYVLDNNDQSLNLVKRWFKLVKNFINKWVNRSDYNIKKLFDKINAGTYANVTKNEASVKEWLDTFTKDGGAPFRVDNHDFKNISNIQFEETVNSLTAFAFLKNNIRVKGDISKIDLNQVKASMAPQITAALVKVGKLTEGQAATRNEIFETFDDVFKKRIIKNLGKYQISVKEREESIRNEAEDKAMGNDVGDSMSQYTKSSHEVSARDNALTAVKIFVAALPNTMFVNGDPTVMAPVINQATGMPTTVDYFSSWNALANELAGYNTFEEMLTRSAELGKIYPLFQTFANELMKLTSAIENESEVSKIARENLKTQIRNTFRKNKSNLLFVATKNVTDESGASFTDIIIRNENANKQIGNTLTGWVNELIQNSKLLDVSTGKYLSTKDTEAKNHEIATKFANLATRKAKPETIVNLKEELLYLLDEIGIKIDMQSLNSTMTKYYFNPSPTEMWDNLISDTTESGVRFLFSYKIPDLKNIDTLGNIKTKYSTNISDFFKRNIFANRLAEAYNINHPTMDEVSVLTTDGKLFYTITEHNYLTDFTQELNDNPETVEQLTKVTYVAGSNANPDKNIKGSTILNSLRKGGKLSVETIVGFKDSNTDDPGRKYTEISPLEDYVMKLALTASNKLVLPTMGDSQRYDVLSGSAIGNNFNYKLNAANGKITFDKKLLRRFNNYFETELETIEFNYANPPVNEKDKIANYDKGARNGYKFRYFNGFFRVKGQTFGGFETQGDFTNFNEALALAEDIDTANNDKDYTTAKSVVAQIRKTWDGMSEADKSALMNNMLLDLFAEELNYAQEIGLISWDGKKLASVKNVALPSKLLSNASKHYSSHADALGSLELLSNYFANEIASVIEFEKLFTKDPAYYKSPVDKIKRYREVLSTGVSPRTDYSENAAMADLTHFTIGTLEDNEIISRQLESIHASARKSSLFLLLQQNKGMSELEALNTIERGEIPADIEDMAEAMVASRFKGYTKVNQTDATVLLSPEGYKQLVRRIDGWTPDVEKAFNVLNNADILTSDNSELYQESLGTLIKPLKVMYFGGTFNEELRREVPIFDKMAMFPVFPVLATGDMKHVLDAMQNPNNPIHMLAFESAVKVGQDAKTKVYKKDGTVNIEGLANIVTHQQALKNFRRQLVTDPHSAHEQMFVTQAQKAAILNVRHGNTYTTTDGKAMRGSEVLRNVFGSIDALTAYGAKTIDNRFGVTEDAEGNQVANSAKVSKVLYDSADASNMNQNVLGGLEVTDGKSNAPLSGLSDNAWMESSLISLMNREIIDTNTPGGMFIQMSSIMYNDLTVRKDGGVRDLKFDNADGSIECVISINLLKGVIPDYDKKTFKQSKDWLIKAGIIGKDTRAMAMGYRIPAQGPSSTAALRVVDVYPENVGDTITLPDEWTSLTGSDFDVDKLFIARYNYDEKGRKVKFESKLDYENKLREKGFDDETIARKAYDRFSGKSEFEANSKEANQNNLLDMYLAVISNPLQYAEAKQPLDTVTAYLTGKVLTHIDGLHGEGARVVNKQLYYASPSFQSRVKAELNGGKFGIGPFALANSHHALAQAIGLQFADNKTLRKYGIRSLSGISSNRPNYHDKKFDIYTNISDWVSALINAHVDVAKDPYIIRLNVRKLTFNMTNMLVRAGKGESAFYFLSQDILRDYAIEHAKYSGKYGVDLGGKYNTPESVAYKKIFDKYKAELMDLGATNQELQDAELKELSQQEAANMFDIKYLSKIMPRKDTKEWYLTQLRVLKAYTELEPAAKALSELTTISQIDTKKFGNNFALQQNFLTKMARFFADNKLLYNAEDIVRDTFLYSKLKYGVLRPRGILKGLMLRLTPEFEGIRNLFYALSTNKMNSDSYVNSITRGMEAAYKTRFIAKYAKANSISAINLMYGSNSIPNRLLELKRDIKNGVYPELLGSDGSFLNALLDNIDAAPKITATDFTLPDFLVFKPNKSAGNVLDDQIIRAWEELLELNNEDVNKAADYKKVRDFARDLAVYAFYTSGDAFGKNNIFKYVPNSFREKIGYFDDVRKLESNPVELYDYITLDSVIPGLWWNEDVVPTVKWYLEEYDEAGQLVKVPKENVSFGDNVIELAEGKGVITIPDIFVDNEARMLHQNSVGQAIFPVYVKTSYGLKNDPNTTMLYKLVGNKVQENGKVLPVYKLVNKKGLNYRGKVFTEFVGNNNTKSVIRNNNIHNVNLVLERLGYNTVTDYMPEGIEATVLDPVKFLTNLMEKKATEAKPTTPVQEAATINIFAGNNENTELSNFAYRPVIIDNVGFAPTGPIDGRFNTVEGAFQAQKLFYANISDSEKEETRSKLETATGFEAQKIGRNIENLDRVEWDRFKYDFAKNIMLESFRQNPSALQKLLATGDATLTHDQGNKKWREEFPRILMEIREELRSEEQPIKVSLATSGYTKGLPQANPNINYVFTENAEAFTFTHDLYSDMYDFPNPNNPKINVSDVNGTNQAGIRTDKQGNITENAYGIIVKKYQQDANGKFVAAEGQFKDNGTDFGLFTSLNKIMFDELAKSTNTEVVFPTQMALGKAALPLRFAEWLQSELNNRFGIESTVEKNNASGYDGYGLRLNSVQPVTENKPEEVTPAPTEPIKSYEQKELDDFSKFVEENSTWIDEEAANAVKGMLEKEVAKPDPFTFTFGNGFKIKTPFELNEQQKTALLEMEAFINDEGSTTFTLMGYAGTGKTTIMSLFDQYLRSLHRSPTYVAPTHRANAVTKQNNPKASTATLHSLLGLRPDFDFSTEEFSLNSLAFNQKDSPIFSMETFVIDESSMIGNTLYDYLVDSLKGIGNKIIFLGDPAQLKPVKSKTISKVFTSDSPRVELTKVERTGDNPILKEATALREGKDLSYTTELNSKGEGVIFTKDKNQIIEYVSSIVNSPEYASNKLYFKVLSGTNDAFPAYNKLIRGIMFGPTAKQVEEGEVLMAYSNEQYDYRNKKNPYGIVNSVDYIVESSEQTTRTLPHSSIKVSGYSVSLRNAFDPNLKTGSFILDIDTPIETIDAIINQIDLYWNQVKQAKARGDNSAVATTLAMKNTFENSFSTMTPLISSTGHKKKNKTFDYGYAHTIHKSQGGTYNKVLVLGGTIDSFSNDPEIQQQLKYVAVSRAKEQVMYTIPTGEQQTQRAQSPTIDLADLVLSDIVIKSSEDKEVAELDRLGISRINEC